MTTSVSLAVLVLALPFASFLTLSLLVPLRRSGRPAGVLSIASMTTALVLALLVAREGGTSEAIVSWLPGDAGPMATIGLLVDPLSSAMLVLITLVSTLVQIYSLAYLHDEPPAGLGRYYAYQSLFAFSMLGLVLAPTFLQM